LKDAFILRLPLELKEQIAKLAKEIGIPAHALMLHILWKHAERRGFR